VQLLVLDVVSRVLRRAVASILATGVIWFYMYVYSTGTLPGWTIPILSILDSMLTFTVAEDYLERKHGLLVLLYLLGLRGSYDFIDVYLVSFPAPSSHRD
jgi:hypothetical protein